MSWFFRRVHVNSNPEFYKSAKFTLKTDEKILAAFHKLGKHEMTLERVRNEFDDHIVEGTILARLGVFWTACKQILNKRRG